MKARKIPLVLFIIGILLIGLYGLVLCVLADLMQIVLVINAWKNNPILKQSNKLNVGVLLYVAGLSLFGVGLYQRSSYFGGIGTIVWLAIGALPFLVGSIILLRLPIVPSKVKDSSEE